MRRLRSLVLSLGIAALGAASAQAQSAYPILDRVAAKVIQKYQTSSCQQLAAAKMEPPSPEKARVIAKLRQDPQMRQAFINQVAAPIVNKLFECGLVP